MRNSNRELSGDNCSYDDDKNKGEERQGREKGPPRFKVVILVQRQ